MTAFRSATHLRQELEGRGIVIQLRGAHLLLSPKGAAHDLLPEVARFKPSLIELLQHEQDARELASVILECRRPDAGFDFGKLRFFWRAANELTGVEMDSAQLGQWAKENATR